MGSAFVWACICTMGIWTRTLLVGLTTEMLWSTWRRRCALFCVLVFVCVGTYVLVCLCCEHMSVLPDRFPEYFSPHPPHSVVRVLVRLPECMSWGDDDFLVFCMNRKRIHFSFLRFLLDVWKEGVMPILPTTRPLTILFECGHNFCVHRRSKCWTIASPTWVSNPTE